MIATMTRRKPGPGRPSKGPRKGYFTRVAQVYADRIDRDADLADVSYSEYIEALIAIGLRHCDELPTEMQPKGVLPEAG